MLAGVCFYAAGMMSLGGCDRAEPADGPRVGLITPGSIADAAWNSGAWDGLQRIRDSLGLVVSHIDAPANSETLSAVVMSTRSDEVRSSETGMAIWFPAVIVPLSSAPVVLAGVQYNARQTQQ